MDEIRDDKLFRQPEISHYGECPICCLPLSVDETKRRMNSCCCKRICDGCSHANTKREIEQGLVQKCAFCREPVPKTDEEIERNLMKRVEANDPVALCQVGTIRCDDKGDYEGAVEYLTKAAGLGDINAHYNLSVMYEEGQGVEKDLKKQLHHLEEAAIGGHRDARFNLGNREYRNGRYDRAIRHYTIAAKLGDDEALETVKKYFGHGYVSKEDFEAALPTQYDVYRKFGR